MWVTHWLLLKKVLYFLQKPKGKQSKTQETTDTSDKEGKKEDMDGYQPLIWDSLVSRLFLCLFLIISFWYKSAGWQ